MKKLYIVILTLLLISLSGCSTTEVEQVSFDGNEEMHLRVIGYKNDEEYIYENLNEYQSDDIYFRSFQFGLAEYTMDSLTEYTSTFGYQIRTSENLKVIISCSGIILISFDVNPVDEFDYINVVSNNNIIGSCSENTQITTTLSNESEVIYTNTFDYQVDREILNTGSNDYEHMEYNSFIDLIVIVVGLVLLVLMLFGYRVYYHKRINKYLKDTHIKSPFLIDVWKVTLLLVFTITVIIGLILNNLEKRYTINHYENIRLTTSNYEELSFDIDNLAITNTKLMIDDGGYRNWPFDGYPETIELDIDYTEVLDEFKGLLRATEGVQICNMGPLGCVLYGPTPAFRVYFDDGVNFLSLSISVEDIDGGQRISTISVMEGNETRLTIPYYDLREEYDAIFDVIDEAYQDYLSSIE